MVICPGLGWGLASCMSVGLRAVAGRLEMPGLGGGSFFRGFRASGTVWDSLLGWQWGP